MWSTLALLVPLVGCAPKPASPLPGADAARVSNSPKTTARTALTGELVVEGPIAQRLSRAPTDLLVFYGSEQKGSTETCGCPRRPRGSLARLDAYVDAAREATPATPSALVNAGGWLQDAMGFDGALRADVALGNRWMVSAVRMGEWDALNVGYTDLAALATLPPDGGPPLPLVSANAEGPGIHRWVIVNRGGLRIGITGITAKGETLTQVPGYSVAAPARAGAVLAELAEHADVIVLLAFQATDAARALAASHPQVDVVIDAHQHTEFMSPTYVNQAAWAYSHYQTHRAGELRLSLADGQVVGGVDRKIDLDPDMPDDRALLDLSRAARVELDAAQRALFGEP